MPENPKKNVLHTLLPILTLALGFGGGYLLAKPSTPPEEVVTISSSETDDVTCDQDLPVVAPVLWRENYTLAYDGRNRNPFWVQEVLTKESFNVSESGKRAFKIDPQLPEAIRSHPEDYAKTGFVHGNMLSASDHKGSPLNKEENSLMSNTCPQCPHLLKGYWASLEQSIHTRARDCDEVKIITGPLYLPHEENGTRFVKYLVIGDNDVSVPTHFFRVVTYQQGEEVETKAFIIPNEPVSKNTPLDQYKVPIEQVERVSGILFAK